MWAYGTKISTPPGRRSVACYCIHTHTRKRKERDNHFRWTSCRIWHRDLRRGVLQTLEITTKYNTRITRTVLSRAHTSAKAADVAKTVTIKQAPGNTSCLAGYGGMPPSNRNPKPTMNLTLTQRDPDCHQYLTVSSVARVLSTLSSTCTEVSGVENIGQCGRLRQFSWLLGAL